MFTIPQGIDVLISWKTKQIAFSDVWRRRITVGLGFMLLPEDQQNAIILHEASHIRLKHAKIRVKSLFLGKWRNLRALNHQHEFEADAMAAKYGYAASMIDFLTQNKQAESWLHPSSVDRIERLELRLP